MFKFLLSLVSNSKFFSPLITIQSALEIDHNGSLNGPEGITKLLPTDCIELKHKIEKLDFIEKS